MQYILLNVHSKLIYNHLCTRLEPVKVRARCALPNPYKDIKQFLQILKIIYRQCSQKETSQFIRTPGH